MHFSALLWQPLRDKSPFALPEEQNFITLGRKSLTNTVMKKNLFLFITALCFASCATKADVKHVRGTIDEPMAEDTAPAHVLQAIASATKFHSYEIMNDTVNNVSVWAIGEADQQSTEGYGIVVTRNCVSTTFPAIRNTRVPPAAYNPETGDLWIAASAMEGTGVDVKRLYQLRFDGDSAYVVMSVDPYLVQQAFVERLEYGTCGEDVNIYIDGEPAIGFTNTVEDMGGFDDDALWIGEQISYDLSSEQPVVKVVPGVKFVTGLMLLYDDTPVLTAKTILADDGTVAFGPIHPKTAQ